MSASAIAYNTLDISGLAGDQRGKQEKELMKDKVVPLVDPEQQARGNFASHVQSVAFNLTLSRRMIDMLQVIRDYGFPHSLDADASFPWSTRTPAQRIQITTEHEEWRRQSNVSTIPGISRMGTPYERHNFVGFMNSLERRGLVYCNPTPYGKRKHGDRGFFLSRSGKIVCDLLVEAGLMVAPNMVSGKLRRAK